MIDLNFISKCVVKAALDAGDIIEKHRISGFQKGIKIDGSIVTDADTDASQIITKALQEATPNIPIICEEGQKCDPGALSGTFWLVDPLDGTIQFAGGRDEFTVNIGLIQDGHPTLGVLYHPPSKEMLVGFENTVLFGKRDNLQPFPPNSPEKAIILGSMREEDNLFSDFREEYKIDSFPIKTQKSSLKFSSLLHGKASIWFRSRNSYEWDTAAGHAILTAAGGKLLTFDEKPLIYGKEGYENPGFIAFAPGF